MNIRKLSQSTINRIAAGEVVERPASVIKELVENSIDAGATNIDIVIDNGGRNLISISDNGCGMSKDDILLAVQRYTTSKLDESDIMDIKYFGFRGEALPSIASVSRMTISSRQEDNNEYGWSLNINGGDDQEMIPSAISKGTKIEVRDLFYAVPARLKFLKSERIEYQHILDIIKKMALANPGVGFAFKSNLKTLLNLTKENLDQRIISLIGQDFYENSVEVNYKVDGMEISGRVSLPTFNRRTSADQYMFVNGRVVRDKLLMTSLKLAYQDYLSSDRFPVAILFLSISNREVDVNAHPAKLEVRFVDSAKIRAEFIRAIKNALITGAHKSSTVISQNVIERMKITSLAHGNSNDAVLQEASKPQSFQYTKNKLDKVDLFSRFNKNYSREDSQGAAVTEIATQASILEQGVSLALEANNSMYNQVEDKDYKLGIAKCQLHQTYIVAQTNDSIIIVDQHAAHERLVYEELKELGLLNRIKRQRLLIPEIIEMDERTVDLLILKKEDLDKLGLVVERNGINAIRVTEIPDILYKENISSLVKDIGDDLLEHEEDLSFKELLEHVIGTYACHYSIRSGRVMGVSEMNALLRKMEVTPYSGQCNHGRPTYVELKLSDIEKLFGRK
jgi:DNA mismatch repair protein MutL